MGRKEKRRGGFVWSCVAFNDLASMSLVGSMVVVFVIHCVMPSLSFGKYSVIFPLMCGHAWMEVKRSGWVMVMQLVLHLLVLNFL